VKQLSESLSIGPKYAASFADAGIVDIKALANVKDLKALSLRTGIPIQLVEQWHQTAVQKIKVSQHRRRVAAVTLIIAFAVLILVGWLYWRSPTRRSARLSAQAKQLYDQENYGQALQGWEQATELDPRNQTAWANKGGVLINLGRHPEAVIALDKALELDPNDYWSFSRRGDAHRNLEKYDDALSDYDRAIKIEPNFKPAMRGKGLTLAAEEKYDAALEALNSLLKLDDNDDLTYSIRGGIYHDGLFQYENGYQDIKKASELDPKSTVYQMDLAEAALTTERFAEASDRAIRIVVDKDPNRTPSDRLAMRFVAIASLLLNGKKDEANKQIKEFIADYKSAGVFYRDWSYEGDTHFIESHNMDRQTRAFLLQSTKLLDSPSKSTIEQVEDLASKLP